MTTNKSLPELAKEYHNDMPIRIREYLNARGISDEAIDHYQLGWDGHRITIPIVSRSGELLYLKLAKDPDDKSDSPKMVVPRGAKAELYGWERLSAARPEIVICEGEFDRLVLESRGVAAVTSTAGAGTFRKEWAWWFRQIEHVYVCFDRDTAGWEGALAVAKLIPQARVVELPPEVGDGGDVTDFFVRLGKSVDDFAKLLAESRPGTELVEEAPKPWRKGVVTDSHPVRLRVDRVKELPIEVLIGRYVKLERAGESFVGLCPFHDERHPSFTVYPQRQNFHCFGCKKSGDVITFVREREHKGFWEAVEFLEQFLPHHGANPAQGAR